MSHRFKGLISLQSSNDEEGVPTVPMAPKGFAKTKKQQSDTGPKINMDDPTEVGATLVREMKAMLLLSLMKTPNPLIP